MAWTLGSFDATVSSGRGIIFVNPDRLSEVDHYVLVEEESSHPDRGDLTTVERGLGGNSFFLR